MNAEQHTTGNTVESVSQKIGEFIFEIAEGMWPDADACRARAKQLCADVAGVIISQYTASIEA